MPLLIGFILIGVLAGSDVLNLINFDDANLAKKIADFLLIFIIFDGGFRVSRSTFHKVAGPSLTLATLGVALTALLLGLFVHFILGFDFWYSMLIASIISSTDAAAVFMITKSNPIKAKLASTLNVESAANDPMAILLTITFVQLASKTATSPWLVVAQLLWQFAGGFIIGFICYKLSLLIINRINMDGRSNYSVLILGLVLFTFGFSDLVKANGIIAVFFFGYYLGNSDFPAKNTVSTFLESLSAIFNTTLFLMLGLLASPHRFVNIWKEALVIVAVMMFIARPLAVFLSTIPFKYSFKEKIFLSWGGIKGAVPIVLATYPMANGLDDGGFIFDTIFFAVLLSCIIQGTTLGPLSRLFKFTSKGQPVSPYKIELDALKNTEYEMLEVSVDEDSEYVNIPLSQLKLSQDMLINSIVRNGNLIVPKGDTVILPKDIIYIMTRTSKADEMKKKFTSKVIEEDD